MKMRRLFRVLLLMLIVVAGPVFGYDRCSERLLEKPDKSKQIDNFVDPMEPGLRVGDDSVRWGGDGIILTIGKNSASMQFGCARAVIPKGLKPVHGKFNVTGTYTPSTAIADAETPESLAIRAEGRITGKRMTLTLTSIENGKVIGSYKLERGKAVRLFRCL